MHAMLDRMKELVKTKDICVLATVSDNRPHCSLMVYATDEKCREIYMVTHRQTKKFRNLVENPVVSLLIDTREEDVGARRPNAKALTVNGVFKAMREPLEREVLLARLVRRHPHLKSFAEDPDAELIRIEIESFLLLEGLTNSHFEAVK
jgi:nitroimidazol reductase NimA-like FMN-containing flavoprotein (pyridoxamine 5'-phosphate oxidase superfamily)